ncbi:MAG: MoaD/ThiS family protein [Burkholderiales bacterium]|nr:MoaD/ThiS family protein [Burkholderiales bacterium]
MNAAPVHVVLISSHSGHYTGGVKEFEIEAKTLHDVIRVLDQRYPGLGEHLEEETSVAIDGEIHEVAYFHPMRPGGEVYFIPKIEGG